MSVVGFVWFLCCISIGGWLLARSNPSKPETTDLSKIAALRPIERVRVGQRIVTPDASRNLSEAALSTSVDPATWHFVKLRMLEPGAPDFDAWDVETLQPPSWIEEHHVVVGARVPVPLDLEEMGANPAMLAEVVSVDPCPPIARGPGRVVLTTVNHPNSFVFDLTIARTDGSASASVGVTGWHKFYSTTRAAWVSAVDLKVGETLEGRNGPVSVVSRVQRSLGAERVYNMTVEHEHVYYVSVAGTLAHNNGCLNAFGPQTGPRPPRPVKDIEVDAKGMVHPTDPPTGASTFGDVTKAPLDGHYHTIPKDTPTPGLKITADGVDVGGTHLPTHHTISPASSMPYEEFVERFRNLPWTYGGKIKK